MYWSSQTLYNKITKKLAALYPTQKTEFNWEVGKNTRFRDENGNIFYDDIENYAPVIDWFDRAVSYTREKSSSEYVNTTLKQFITSNKQRKVNKEKALEAWRDKILEELLTEKEVRNWYADGSACIVFRNYFKKFVKAKPLFKAWSSLYPPAYYSYCFYFTYNKKRYFLDGETIRLIK